MSEIILYGSATHRNTGDLAMMHGLIDWLHRQGHRGQVVLMTRNPVESEKEFGIPCFMSHDVALLAFGSHPSSRIRLVRNGTAWLFKVAIWRFISPRLAARYMTVSTLHALERLAAARMVIVHGSGSFNSVFYIGWLYPKAITAIATALLKVPIVMTSQGIGPFDNRADRWMARIFFRRARLIGIRDGAVSRQAARENGAPDDRIILTGDDSDLLPPAPENHITEVLRLEGIPEDGPLIGVNFRDASSYHPGYADRGYEQLAEALDDLVEHHHARLVFIPITYDPLDDDRKSAARVVAHMKRADRATIVKGEYTAALLRGLVGRMAMAVGSSYHFLLFALSQSVPSLALTKNPYYEVKHRGLMTLYHQSDQVFDISGSETGPLTEAVNDLWQQRDGISTALAKRNGEIHAETALARDRLAKQLGSSD
jgi:polysaccharide pyruvyl transferase WcaK-like protein